MSLLVGVAVAGVLIWAAAQVDADNRGGYWATIGILAAAGFVLSLARLARVRSNAPVLPSIPGFVLGFLPALIAAGWVIVARQPGSSWVESHVRNWSGDLSLGSVVADLGVYAPVLAFGLGTLLGFVFTRLAFVPSPPPAAVADEPAPRGERVVEERGRPTEAEREHETVGAGSNRR
jgi:prepilin signal peptidase PulO-like enzyme (type II secretory pathway)